MEKPKNEIPEKTDPELMTAADVARRLNCSLSFVYEILGSRLRHYRLGKGQGGIRVSEEQLLEFLQKRESGGEPQEKPAPTPKPTLPKLKHLSRGQD